MAISQNFPNTRPSLNLNFARSKTLDPRITFSRANTTATYVDDNGLIVDAGVDEPRFDHDPTTGESLGLLVEEQRTNVIQVSAPSPSDISQASTAEGWRDRSNINLEYSSVTSPDGTNNAVGVAYTSAYTTFQVPFIYGDQGTLTSNTSYTLSYWVDDSELVESNNFHLSTIIGTNGWGSIGRYFIVNYNKTSDTFGSPSYSTGASVTAENANTIFTDISGTVSHYPNNWKRISISFTVDSSYDGYYDSGNTTPDLRFNYGIYMGVAGYTNDNVGNNMKTWGWQLEAGAFPTSYIPTSGSQVTRTADNVSMTGTNFSDWYNQTEGTVYCAFKLNSTATARVFNIDDGTNTNRISGLVGSSLYQTYISPAAAGPTASFSNIFDFKIASGHQDNNIQVYVNSIYQNSNTSITIPKNLNTFRIGNWHNGTFQGTTISQLTYYPTRLSNTVLQTLTK